MRRGIRAVATLLAAVAALAALPAAGAAATPVAGASQATDAFGLTLLRKLPSGNLVFSPDSIETALAMAGVGARGATAAQIAHALGLASPASFAAVGKLQATLAAQSAAAQARDPEAPRLSIADGLFVQEGFPIEPTFLASLAQGFGAAPQPLDFVHRNAQAVQAINEWADTHTEGVIPHIVDKLTAATRLVLANAMYLNARWALPFNANGVQTATFHAARSAVPVPFMNKTLRIPYAAGSGYRAVELPYRSSTLSLLVVMPQGRSLDRLQLGFTAKTLGALTHRLHDREVALSLPKFHISFKDEELPKTLKALGMKLAFTERADLSGMSACACLHIGPVIHAADIRVEEEGTIAAAVTVVGIEVSSAERPAPRPVRFDADRPFLFFLRDNRTGTILFAGRLTDAVGAQA